MPELPPKQSPITLGEFINLHPFVEHGANGQIYLYHGTNCYRRLEIKLAGAILPGRGGLTFFTTRLTDAHAYAHVACMRDAAVQPRNSLTGEPVVLKVAFDETCWRQVDFIQASTNCLTDGREGLNLAVVDAIDSLRVVDVLYCSHILSKPCEQPIRSFADGRLMEGIRRLRGGDEAERPEVIAMRKVASIRRMVSEKVAGARSTELTYADQVRKLRQSQFRR
jgi:hypothetical protein